jgi:SAM-dependent methyltransferase
MSPASPAAKAESVATAEQLVRIPAVSREARVDPVFASWVSGDLVWLPERGMGYYPVTEQPYDAAYFEKYRGYAETELGRQLTAQRVAMVCRHLLPGAVVLDVGIGSGQFVEAIAEAGWASLGFDINPAGVEWLLEGGRFWDPREQAVEALTFWDALEHIPDPAAYLAGAREWVFVSLPIFDGPEQVLRSKHFRPDEHCWYWTREGLINWMAHHRFRCVEHNTNETLLGREDVHSFAFRRIR